MNIFKTMERCDSAPPPTKLRTQDRGVLKVEMYYFIVTKITAEESSEVGKERSKLNPYSEREFINIIMKR